MAKPVVDGLERTMDGKMAIARMDVADDEGRAIAQKYGVSSVPAFIVLDGKGNVLYRKIGGKPDVAQIESAVAALGK